MSKLQDIEAKAQGAIQSVVNAVSDLVSRKIAPEDKEKANSTPEADAPSTYAQTLKKLAEEKQHANVGADPAHAPGHRKLGHRKLGLDGASTHAGATTTSMKPVQPQASALNNNAKSDIIHQNESEQRRIIPGASIERKGRRS